MKQPLRLLDLFSGAGGAAVGYHRAGFTEIVGVDNRPQKNYPFTFIQADALEFLAGVQPGEYDLIHASPPCQGYSGLKGLTAKEHPRLIEPVRAELQRIGGVWAIENVEGAPLHSPVLLCGSSFGLRVWRHRLFEVAPQRVRVLSRCRRPQCRHAFCPEPLDVTGTGGMQKTPRKALGGGLSRKPKDLTDARDAMGIDWMTRPEIAQAIPPAYTHWLGRQLLTADQESQEAQPCP
jgi:DNA (cytosine-5)-methyltransferase 1